MAAQRAELRRSASCAGLYVCSATDNSTVVARISLRRRAINPSSAHAVLWDLDGAVQVAPTTSLYADLSLGVLQAATGG